MKLLFLPNYCNAVGASLGLYELPFKSGQKGGVYLRLAERLFDNFMLYIFYSQKLTKWAI